MTDFRNKLAIITGASYGIGRAISIALAKHGCETLLIARNEKNLIATKELIEKTHGKTICIPMDIANNGDINKLHSFLVNNNRTVNFLINNASGWISGPLQKSSHRSLEELYRTTVYGTSVITKTIIPFLRRAGGGNIIFIGSTAGTMHRYSLNTPYVAAKSAVAGLSWTFGTLILTVHYLFFDLFGGRFLCSDRITIRYKLFYWSRHFCPMSRANPVFLFLAFPGSQKVQCSRRISPSKFMHEMPRSRHTSGM